jgi:hypothetical protein
MFGMPNMDEGRQNVPAARIRERLAETIHGLYKAELILRL